MPAESKLKTTTAVLRATIQLKDHELAKLLGCSKHTIASLESGRLKLSESMAVKMSHETGVSAQWLLAGDPKITPFTKQSGLRMGAYVPFTKEIFERHASGAKQFDTETPFGFSTDFITFAMRLRRIMAKANEAHTYHMAKYRIDRTLDALDGEFDRPPYFGEEERIARACSDEEELSEENVAAIKDKKVKRFLELHVVTRKEKPDSDEAEDIREVLVNDVDRYEAITKWFNRKNTQGEVHWDSFLQVEDLSPASIASALKVDFDEIRENARAQIQKQMEAEKQAEKPVIKIRPSNSRPAGKKAKPSA